MCVHLFRSSTEELSANDVMFSPIARHIRDGQSKLKQHKLKKLPSKI